MASHVQGKAIHSTIPANGQCSITLASPVGVGNWVAGAIITSPNGVSLTSIGDDKSNVYTNKDSLADVADSRQVYDFELGNITNQPQTVTVTLGSGTGNAFLLIVDEYSGVLAASDPTDGHAIVQRNAPGTVTDAITSSSITTTVNGDEIYSICLDIGVASVAPTAGTGLVGRASDTDATNSNAAASEDKAQSTAGSVSTTFTDSANGATDNFIVIIMAVKSAPQTVFSQGILGYIENEW